MLDLTAGETAILLKNGEKMEAVISANKFLDLLSCVLPAASTDEARKEICMVQLEILSKDYSIRAVATNGAVLSIAQRQLGFEDELQTDLEDIEGREKVKDAVWLISATDIEILILSLKKLGVKRGKEDESGGRYYIALRETEKENKKKLSISVLGFSHIVFEPDLTLENYPNWQNIIPKNSSEIDSVIFDTKTLQIINKCWGAERIFMNFYNQGLLVKINRHTVEQEKKDDFILIRTLIEQQNIEELEQQNKLI